MGDEAVRQTELARAASVEKSDATAAPVPLRRRWIDAAQCDLKVGAVDDPAEAEADRIAEQVVRRLASSRGADTQPGSGDGSDGDGPNDVSGANGSWVRRAAHRPVPGGPAEPVGPDLERRIRPARAAGRPMDEPLRRTMERGFQSDLSAVRFHTGPDVDALNAQMGARAFTVGSDVFFRGGVPDVQRAEGRRLIAHELAHTFQQGGVGHAPVVRRRADPKKPRGTAEIDAYIKTKGDKFRKFLGEQFGQSGMGFGRSDKAREWRKTKVKDPGREQAREDVDRVLDNYDDTEDGNRSLLDTEKAYYRLSAKKRVHQGAKGSVNDAVSDAVDDVYARLWNSDTVRFAATKARNDHLAQAPGDDKGADRAAQAEIDRWYQRAKAEGQSAKRVVFGKQAGGAQLGQQVMSSAIRMDTIGDEARQKVTDQKVGEKAVKKTIEADSVEAGMGVFGTLLDNVVGSSGDQVSLSIEFKVPVGEGFYVAFTLAGKAARGIDGAMTAGVPVFGDPRRLEVMAEFKFRAGWGIPEIFDVGGDIKLFTRAGANDTAPCMKALSYGAYRRLGAINTDMANWWAGASTGGDEGKTMRAESWAAMVEEQVFKERADGKSGGGFVDVGGGLGVSTELGNQDGLLGGFGFGGGLAMFHRYDEDALKSSLGSSFGTVVADKQAAKQRRKDVKGKYGGAYNFHGKATLNVPWGTKVELAGSISGSVTSPANFGIEITGTLGYAGDSTSVIEQWAAGYATAVADILKGFPKAVKPLMTDRLDFGVFTEAIGATTQSVNAGLENTVNKGLADAWTVDSGPAAGEAALGMSSSLQVALIGGCDGKKPIFRVEIRSGRKLEINTPMAGAAGVKITGEKTSRLAAFGLDGGKLDVEALGVRARGKTNQRGKKHRV